jgi:hypothetical protein
MSLAKPADKLTPEDWQKYPVWTFDLGNEAKPGRDETWMTPLKKLPATDLRNGGCHANAILACGDPVTVVLQGVKLQNDPKENALWEAFARIQAAQNLTPFKPQKMRYSIWVKDRWWMSKNDGHFLSLIDFQKHEPAELAAALGHTLDEVFPISYDISLFAIGPADIVKGKISLATE